MMNAPASSAEVTMSVRLARSRAPTSAARTTSGSWRRRITDGASARVRASSRPPSPRAAVRRLHRPAAAAASTCGSVAPAMPSSRTWVAWCPQQPGRGRFAARGSRRRGTSRGRSQGVGPPQVGVRTRASSSRPELRGTARSTGPTDRLILRAPNGHRALENRPHDQRERGRADHPELTTAVQGLNPAARSALDPPS